MRAYCTDTHNIAEGAGAAALAALVRERAQMAGRKAGLVLSGGNIDREVYLRVLGGEA
jgi:threonine dehydratase